MKLNRTQFARALFACAAAIGTSSAACAAEARWIGGDQSAVLNSLEDTANWDLGISPTNISSDVAFILDQDGAYATLRTGTSGYDMYGTNLTIGAASSPSVTVSLTGNRTNPPDNDNPAQVMFNGILALVGSNSTLRIDKGMQFALRKEFNPILLLDPRSRICGEGVLAFGSPSCVTPAYDFDALQLFYGRDGDQIYNIAGDVSTRGRLTINSAGGGATGRTVTLKLNGHTFECGALRLGLADNIRDAEHPGDQSSFGALDFGGGTLRVAGDFYFADIYGALELDSATPLASSSRIDSKNGGAIELGGSFTNITTRFPKVWTIQDVDFTLNGSGAVQSFEAMSADLGDAPAAAIENYCWRDITIAAGASVVLVDQYDNNTADRGAPEVVYCRNLTIEPGASLDLAGHKIYHYGSADIQGSVTPNGGAIAPIAAMPIIVREYKLDTINTNAGNGMWIGEIAAGDINNDGVAELFVFTSDANAADDDCKLHALNYADGALTSLPNYPVSDQGLAPGINNPTIFDSAVIEDMGGGAGKRLYYALNASAKLYSVGADPSAPGTHVSVNDARYGRASMAYGDIDRDGRKEVVLGGRNGAHNLGIYDVTTGALKWGVKLPARANIVTHTAMADLDLDGSPEILAMPASENDGSPGVLWAFRADGSYYTAPGAAEPLTNMPFTAKTSESYGALSAANVDADPLPEIIFCSVADGLTVMKQDGTVIFTVAPNTYTVAQNAFALFDFDGDGIYEILHGRCLYDGSGTVLDTLPIPTAPSAIVAINSTIPPVLADLNGDQIPEAIYMLSIVNGGNMNYGRYICAYDFVSQKILPGFPVALKFPLKNSAFENVWFAGPQDNYHATHIIAADIDADGTWEIIVGTGLSRANANIGGVTHINEEDPRLNIISTPYRVSVPEGRTAEDYGWYSWKKNSRMDCKFPLYVPQSTLIMIR